MGSFRERLFDTIIVLATPLLAAVTRKAKPKRAAARPNRKRAPAAKRPPHRPVAKRAARPAAAKKTARPSAAKKGARPSRTAGRAGARVAGRAGARASERAAAGTAAAKAPAAAPAGPPPPKPVPPTGRAILLSPENGKFAESLHPKFRWLSVGGATRYEVAWSDSPSFSDSHTIVSIATEAAVPDEEPLSVGVVYYWRVRGGNESGWGPWSPASSFQVLEEPPAP